MPAETLRAHRVEADPRRRAPAESSAAQNLAESFARETGVA